MELTAPLAYPAPLGESFSVQDIVEYAFDLMDLLDQANADRASVKALGQ